MKPSFPVTTILLAFVVNYHHQHQHLRLVLGAPKSVPPPDAAADAEIDTDADSDSDSDSDSDREIGFDAPAITQASESNHFIYGGEDIEPGEFPYYVQFPRCGGTLIARDFVLSAAHCPDNTGYPLIVGAYKRNTPEGGGVLRKCSAWITHPLYDGTKYDVALCKLDQPIGETDEQQQQQQQQQPLGATRVKLELHRNNNNVNDYVNDYVNNNNDGFAGKDLVAVGLGYIDGEGNLPSVTQKTTLRGITDEMCERAVVEGYKMPYSDALLCADGEGKTDVCAGDSGGPLVLIEKQQSTSSSSTSTTTGGGGGPDIHHHVGSVSYGARCPIATVGVYAKTSEMMPWIDKILCEESSIDAPSSCNNDNNDDDINNNNINSNSPTETPGPEDPDDDGIGGCGQELTVRVTTDLSPSETTWILRTRTAGKKWEPLLERGFREREPLTGYEETICLEAGASYKWTIRDSAGDGLCHGGDDGGGGEGEDDNNNDNNNSDDDSCGSFSLTLNGDVLFARHRGDFSDKLSTTFRTFGGDGGGDDGGCADPRGRFPVRLRKHGSGGGGYKSVRKTCRWVDKQLRKKGVSRGRKLCLKDSGETLKVFDICKKTCGAVGLGECGGNGTTTTISV